MFITRAKYNRLIKDKEEWKDIAIRVQKTNELMLQTAKQVNTDNQELLQVNKDLLELVDNLKAEKAEIAKEIFKEFENTIMHPNWGSFEQRKDHFEKLKKKYIGGE